MKLSEEEKKEMLEDAYDKRRKNDFSVGEKIFVPKTFEEYVSILEQLQKIYDIKIKKEIIEYKNIKI